MATPPRPNFNLDNIVAPDVGGSLIDFANMQSKQFQLGLSNVMAEERARIAREQEEREKLKFDKEVNTDKALIDFQNQIASASAGGVASMEQGTQLADEYNRLLKTVGEDEAARIINDKAQKFGAQDVKRAESDPYYRAELIKGVALPSGNIDPKSLIDLRNSQITRNETLGQRKDDLETRAKEREEDLWFKKQELAMRQAERNERAQEKLDAKKAVAEIVARSIAGDKNTSSSGILYDIIEEKTGKKTIKDGVSISENEGIEELSKMKALRDRIDALASKNKINYEDRDVAFEVYKKENPEAANSSETGKVSSRAFDGAVDNVSSMAKTMLPRTDLFGKTYDKWKEAFMSDIEREEYNKKLDETKAKELQESLKSNSPGNKANDVNISFDNYWKLKKDQQAIDNAELKKLQKELEDTGLKYYNNLANEYGVDEIKSVPKEMTPHKAKIYTINETLNAFSAKGIAPEIAIKFASEEGEKAEKKQADFINNVNKDAKESAKNGYTEVQEARKAIDKKIETLDKYKRDIGDNKEKKIWYDTEWLEISEVQRRIGEEISKLERQRDNLK